MENERLEAQAKREERQAVCLANYEKNTRERSVSRPVALKPEDRAFVEKTLQCPPI